MYRLSVETNYNKFCVGNLIWSCNLRRTYSKIKYISLFSEILMLIQANFPLPPFLRILNDLQFSVTFTHLRKITYSFFSTSQHLLLYWHKIKLPYRCAQWLRIIIINLIWSYFVFSPVDLKGLLPFKYIEAFLQLKSVCWNVSIETL